jgi:hypothetical protein
LAAVIKGVLNQGDANNRPPLVPGLLVLILVLLKVVGAMNALHDLQNQPELQISAAVVETLRQEQHNIPAGAHVLIAGNAVLREWAPALLEREVLNCRFGLEWQPDELKQVYRINDALESNDLTTVMADVWGYSGDTRIWLIGAPEQVAKLTEEDASPSIEISIQDQTPDLISAIIHNEVAILEILTH